MSVPVFIEIEQSEQLSELATYLKSKGADISDESADAEASLSEIVSASDVLWKEGTNDADIELVYNAVIALVMVQPFHNGGETLINVLCEKLAGQTADRQSALRLRLLNNLFCGLDESSPLRYVVYMSLIKLAGHANLIHIVNPKLEEIRHWLTVWDVGMAKNQALLRSLYEAFTECRQSDKATKTMVELLGTYTDENASQAREDAHKCIVTSLADPNTLLFDHLLTLKPVKFLEGELIHELLTIFVTGKIQQYMEFYTANKDFVSSLGLLHEENMHKMQLLTFVQLAEGKSELSFETIEKELHLTPDDVEAFIINVVRTKAINAKMDHPSRRVIVSRTIHRTFGKPQWQQLHDQLRDWQENVSQVLSGFVNLQKSLQTQQTR